MNWDRLDFRRLVNAAALAFRLTAAALLALWLAHRLKVGLPLWSVLTALVVTQISLGRSLKATLDYFAGTIGGVMWGACVAAPRPAHHRSLAPPRSPACARAPCLYRGSPSLAHAGPITAAIVVLLPQMMHTSPIDSAMERVSEVLLGGVAGLFVSFVLVPWSAFQHTREVAAQSLDRMAKAVPGLIAGFEQGLDDAKAHRLQDGIGRQLNELSSVAAEAERERPLRMAADPLTGPLSSDLVEIAPRSGDLQQGRTLATASLVEGFAAGAGYGRRAADGRPSASLRCGAHVEKGSASTHEPRCGAHPIHSRNRDAKAGGPVPKAAQ